MINVLCTVINVQLSCYYYNYGQQNWDQDILQEKLFSIRFDCPLVGYGRYVLSGIGILIRCMFYMYQRISHDNY